MTRPVPTVEFSSLVYGQGGVPLDDPAETFHEASRLYPHLAPGRLTTLLALGASPELQQTVARSSRTHRHRPAIQLPPSALPRRAFREVLAERHSGLAERRRPLTVPELATVLGSSYAASSRVPGTTRRPVPSGGALYPLELYVIALAIDEVEPGVSHYDPFRHRLELLAPLDPDRVAAALVDPTLLGRASAVIVVTGLFWRSRFKYGTRGYRFVLLEAGHLIQNAVLAAAALRLLALPLGGFYDRRLDELVGADGLDEASVYAVLIGGRE
jgi:SagB-type dehydrogenase family enzyme